MIPLINKDHIKIEPVPVTRIPQGLFIRIPKLESKTMQGVMVCDIVEGQSEYPYPKGVTAKDIRGTWIQKV